MKYNVGDKFVIEIGERFVGSNYQIDLKTGDIKEKGELFRVKNYNTLVFDEKGLDKLDRLNDDYINEHYRMFQDAAYQKGLEDAWEIARKLALNKMDGGMSSEEMRDIFGFQSIYNIFKNHTASETLEKIREFEEKQEAENEINIGDEVVSLDNRDVMVVTKINENFFDSINRLGDISTNSVCNYKKTGRYFPQIAEVLERMKEADNGN